MDFTPFMLTALPEPYAMINRLRRAHFSMTAHTHRFWQLILVTDGVLTARTGCCWPASPPGRPRAATARCSTIWTRIWRTACGWTTRRARC